MRRLLIAGNWKMHKSHGELRTFVEQLADIVTSKQTHNAKTQTWVAPPATLLDKSHHLFAPLGVEVGAQNVHYASNGAFTGELSLDMIKEAGASFTLVGHSERRQFFGETDPTIAKKVAACQAMAFPVIACIGETLEERNAGRTMDVCGRQLAAILEEAPNSDSLIIAYEPVWAIGTGVNATAQQAQEVHAYIRSRLVARYGETAAHKIRILYGGSVKPANVAELLAQIDVDGALVGGASLEASDFAKLILAANAHS